VQPLHAFPHPTRATSIRTALLVAVLLGGMLPGRLSGQAVGEPPLAQEQSPGEVTGVVRDATTGAPVTGASVSLHPIGDTTRVRNGVTNAAGRVLFVGLAPGAYRIRVESLAYGAHEADGLVVAPGARIDLGVIGLTVEALELEALSVTAERPMVVFEADRTTYDVGAMPSSQGAATADLLRSMPELEVDLDGQVSMRGARTEIYIDGRPAPMTGASLAAFLEQFPADLIESVEVIDNPSARYSAQGSGGIVNIVLREGVELGVSGTAFLNAGTRGQVGTGARATLQRGPWTVNGGLTGDRSDRTSSSFDLRQNLLADPTHFVEQESDSRRTGLSGNTDFEVRYQPNAQARFWVLGRVTGRDADQNGATRTTYLDATQAPTSGYARSNARETDDWSTRLGTGFTYTWERRRHEFELEVQLDRNRNREDTREVLETFEGSPVSGPLPANLALGDDVQRNSDVQVTVDYVRPMTQRGRFEVGYRLQADRADSDRFLRALDGTSEGVPNETALGFDHDQTFNALYVTLQRELGIIGVQAGLRGEHADTRFETPAGEVFDNDYVSLFPSASVSARFDQGRQLRLSYSRRIGRPSTSVLNPIDRSTDPLNRRVGNPSIDAQYTHSFSLDADWQTRLGRVRLAPYYRKTDGGWAQITLVDEEGISTRTWDNVTSEERYGATLTTWLPRGQPVTGFVSIGGNKNVQDATNLSARYSNSSFRWQTRANLEGAVTDDLSVEGRFTYTPAVDLPQGRTDARVSTDFGLRYRFLDRRASLRMSFEDPLGLQRSSFETRDLTHVQIGRSSESTRSMRLNLSYAFGGTGSVRGGGGRRR